jgi:DNA-binding CsgD family transcriptional regulator/tetratricopeptide (TPR) repeat protein
VIGRERELEELGEILGRTGEGEGGLLLLAGEAGVGKTRLAEAALATGRLACLRGVAAERGASPYAPIAAVLRQYLRREPAGLPSAEPLVAHLGVLLPELGRTPAGTDRETLFEAVRGAFETISAHEATVVFLDDLQWADAATLELLPSLAEAAEEWPLLVLGAYRTEEIPRGHPLRRLRTDLRRAGRLAELSVEPLDAEATARIAARVLDGDPGPALCAALYDRTQGVPFFVEELAAALRDGARLASGPRGLELEKGSSVPIPETLRDALRVRVEGLSEAGRTVLEAAAVVGAEVELELLAELGRDAGLGEVLERGLLQEAKPGIAAFRHDLLREALYADTHWPRRRSLHRELADVLEARGAEPRLTADHWLAAGERGRALPLLIEAARRSCKVHAYRDAAAAGRAALEIWPEGEEEPGRLDVLEELGRCAQVCGELGEAGRVWEEVAAGLDGSADSQRLADVKRRLATVYELEGATPRAAAARLEAADAFEAAGLHADAAGEWLLGAHGVWDDTPSAERALDRAVQAARRAGRSDLESRCLTSQGFLTGRTGRLAEGLELIRSALSLALGGNHVDAAMYAYWALGATANDWANYEAAQSAFDEAVVYCQANELSEGEHFCLGCLVVVLGNSGEWTRAEELGRDLLVRTPLPDVSKAHALMTLGLISTARGATKRGRGLLGRAHALARELGLEHSEHECLFGLALVDELEGAESSRWHEFVAHPIAHVASARPRGLRLASTFAARRRETELVYACADATASWASRFGSADALAALAHVLGEVGLLEGKPSSAADQFGQALERLAEVEAPFERALTQARAGVALIAAGERELGVERLTGAYHTFRKLGARPFATRTAADLEAAGERVEERLGRRASHDLKRGGLTRRELEILRLVAVGRTNREIAHHLFLSPRTVDMHVRNMLAKLGCRSRTEATGRAHELGLLEPVATGARTDVEPLSHAGHEPEAGQRAQ